MAKVAELYWAVDRSYQGQMVQEHYIQVNGASEGPQEAHAHCTLTADRSDLSWVIYDRGEEVLRSRQGMRQPTPEEALLICKYSLEEKRQRKTMESWQCTTPLRGIIDGLYQ